MPAKYRRKPMVVPLNATSINALGFVFVLYNFPAMLSCLLRPDLIASGIKCMQVISNNGPDV